MSTVKIAGTQTLKVLGQNVHAPFGSVLAYTYESVGAFPILDGTPCMQGFQISADEMSVITGYYLKNKTAFPVTFAPNDGDGQTLGAGGSVFFISPGSGDGEVPVSSMMIYTEVFHTTDGEIEFTFYGDP